MKHDPRTVSSPLRAPTPSAPGAPTDTARPGDIEETLGLDDLPSRRRKRRWGALLFVVLVIAAVGTWAVLRGDEAVAHQTLENDAPVALSVTPGRTDGQWTEMRDGEVTPGTPLLTNLDRTDE